MPDLAPSSIRPLAGHIVVFTGRLAWLGRRDAHALVERLGGVAHDEVTARTTMLIVGSEPAGTGRGVDAAVAPGEVTQKLRRAAEINEKTPGRVQILDEAAFCAVAGLPSPGATQQYYGQRELLLMYPHLRDDHLRYLEKWGLIRPVLRTTAGRFYAFGDLRVIRQADAELAQGAAFRTVLRGLVAAHHGQLAFDFRLDASPARVFELRRREPPQPSLLPADGDDGEATARAEALFLEASALDDRGAEQQAEAARLYRQALHANPDLVAAVINLGNIHYACDEMAEAQALYERALALDADAFEAHFNLGNINHDLGRFRGAEACYRDALALNPDYAEAHFYLAVTLEKCGQSAKAKPHWKAYRRLAPDGDWAELAKEFAGE